jgi:hypothetical protein
MFKTPLELTGLEKSGSGSPIGLGGTNPVIDQSASLGSSVPPQDGSV